jgi:hypothetical protein
MFPTPGLAFRAVIDLLPPLQLSGIRGLVKDDGTAIPNRWVGLRKTNRYVRQSFSPIFREYLETMDPWFGTLENFAMR